MTSKDKLIERVARRMLADMEDHGGVDDFCEKLLGYPEQYLSELAAGAVEAAKDETISQLSGISRELGEAEGKLAASEMAGVVEGWKKRAERAEAETERLREAFGEYIYQTTSRAIPATVGGREYRECLIPYSAIRDARAALEGGDNADQQTG